MAIEYKPYPNDFYSRKLSLIVVMRKDDQPPQTVEDYFAALNLQANCIETLAFLLGAMSKYRMEATDPENLSTHFETLSFLLMSFGNALHDDADSFRKRFELEK